MAGRRAPAWRRAAAALALLACAVQACAAGVTAYTEEWPPYNFAERGRPVGIATDLLLAACARARIECRVEIVPWARAYRLALTQPNTLVFSTARTAARERDFAWIGPILPRRTWVFGRADSPAVASISALSNYRVGVASEDAAARDLVAQGLDQSAIDRSGTDQDSLRKLAAGRIDFVTGTEVGMAWGVRRLGIELDLKRLLPLSNEGAYYFALNPKSDAGLAERLQRAYDELLRSGERERIVARYTSAQPVGPAPSVPQR